MFKNLINRIAGDDTTKALARLAPMVTRCNALEPEYMKLSDIELRAKTDEFRQRVSDGEKLDDLMSEAFAAVREAARRTVGLRHYDVQLVGGALLHQGKIAEMRTGEGKTLVATCPLYLNALLGQGAHLVTQNDYLAKRDAQWMGAIYHMLGMSVGTIQSAGEGRPDDASYLYDPAYPSKDDRLLNLRPVKRTECYHADITYGTNNEYGFDYLRDNMTQDLAECTQRVDEDGSPLLYFSVIDEVDNLLIDEARTPLIISGQADEPSPLYKRFSELVRRLEPSQKNDSKDPDGDYIVELKTKNVTLTEQGIIKIEHLLGIENLYSPEHAEMTPYLDNALRAYVVYERDRDYVVSDKREIIIVDEFTGRMMYGRRFSEGLHQAIEAKENVKVQRESLTYATITFQNFFRMYEKLSGMTGTALTEAEEFFKIYSLEVVPLPTNIEYQAMQKKLQEQKDKFFDGTPIFTYIDPKNPTRKYYRRLDYADLVYKTHDAKFKAVVDEIAAVNATGRPILVGTIAIETSESLSNMLSRKGVNHQVLNAKQHEKEAVIIAQAGRMGQVTIATNMAGRGVDILLGGNTDGITRERLRKQGVDLTQVPKEVWQAEYAGAEAEVAEQKKQVLALGGLHVIGTERHEARRIDNQLRGRCARQGDPGSTRFYVSLEDELMQRFGGERVKSLMTRLNIEDDMPLEYNILSKSIEQAQEKVEGYNFDLRKHVIKYDDVVNKQREVIYAQRRTILEKDDLRETVMSMVNDEIKALVETHMSGEPENWDLTGLVNEMRVIVPLPKDFDAARWARSTRDEIARELQTLAEGRYEAGLREFGQVVQTQLRLADISLADMRNSRDALMRNVYRWAKNHLGDALTPELEALPFNDIPADYADALNTTFFDGARLFRDRSILIQTVDQFWVRHLTDLDELREGIGLRAYAQRDPLVSFRTEASNMYADLLDSIRKMVAQRIFNIQFNVPQQAAPRQQRQAAQQLQRAADKPQAMRASGGSAAASGGKPAPMKVAQKVGRNDVCPWCGSGKKVKHCSCDGARKYRGEMS